MVNPKQRNLTSYGQRIEKAKALREQGNRIIGYFCCLMPLELITASGIVPFRLTGNMKGAITQADAYLETNLCPFVRNCFDLALRGDYEFLDGLIIPHACDTLEKLYTIWRCEHPFPYMHFLNVPHMTRPTSIHFYMQELEILRRSLEDLTGKSISGQDIRQAIQLHNEVRGLLRDLYRLRRGEPPRVSGSEAMKITLDGFGLPASDYRLLLKNSLAMIKAHPKAPSPESVRVLVYGTEVDDASLLELIEQCGATVSMDDLCTGSRSFWQDVELTNDPLEGLAKHYLLDIKCPRTYRPRYGDYHQDLENRFGYLKEYVEEFRVNGVIMYIMRYCDSHEFDAPDVKEYLQRLGVPVLYLEEEYSLSSTEQLRSRIEAFVEMIS